MKSIADHMADVLREHGRTNVWYGDLDEIHECARRAGLYDRQGNTHPLAINNRVLSALGRSRNFSKSYIKHIGRPARCFTLRESVTVLVMKSQTGWVGKGRGLRVRITNHERFPEADFLHCFIVEGGVAVEAIAPAGEKEWNKQEMEYQVESMRDRREREAE